MKLEAAQVKFDVGFYADLKTGLADLSRHMLVLHEQVIDTVKAIADPGLD